MNGIRLNLCDLDDEANERGMRWNAAADWHWVDATAWVASHDPDLMALLAGYRDFRDRAHALPVGEGACRAVLEGYLSLDDIARAERAIRGWCKDGALKATALTNDTVVPASAWVSGREPIANDIPAVIVSAATLKDLSPATAAATETHQAEPERSGVSGRPTSAHLVRDELKRRAAAGEMVLTVAGEAKALSSWLAMVHPHMPQLTPRSAENTIRNDHRRLKPDKPH